MDKIKESELYLNEGIESINKILDSKKLSKQREDFRRILRLLLLLYAELNIERENYPKAAQCLKAAIEIMIDDNQTNKIRHKTQGCKNDRFSLKFLKSMKYIIANFSKSGVIATNLSFKPLKNKNKSISSLDNLYEIQFFSSPSEKVLFEEKIKSMINGLFNRIILFFEEKEKKEEIKKKKISNLRTDRKKKTDKSYLDDYRRKRADTLVIREENLIELNFKNILHNSKNFNNLKSNLIIDNYTARERTKTLSRKKRANFLKEKALEKEKENENNENSLINEGNELKIISKEAKNKIINYLNDKMIKKKKILDNEKDISDFKYFFLLLLNLSYRQIELLNNTQSLNLPMEVYKNLPILFTRQFKNSLNPTQRNMLNKLRVLSLIRSKVLKDVNKPISVDNLNYSIFHCQLNFNDFKIKHYSNILEIIQEISASKIKKKTTNRNYKRYISSNSDKRCSFPETIEEIPRGRMTFRNNKKLKFDSSDEEEEDENIIFIDNEDDIEFDYEDKFDLHKLKSSLLRKIQKNKKYKKDERELLKEIINSGLFIQLMNSLELSEIIELEKNLDNFIDYLIIFGNIKLKNNDESFVFNSEEKNKSKNEDEVIDSSTSNSIEIDIDEKEIINNEIRRTLMFKSSKYVIGSGHSMKNLPYIKKNDVKRGKSEKKVFKRFEKAKTIRIKKDSESSD